MGNRGAKKSSTGESKGFFGRKKKKDDTIRPFPAISAQSYLPGSAAATGVGLNPNYGGPPTGVNPYPYPPAPISGGPPMVNFNTGYGPPTGVNPYPPAPMSGGPPMVNFNTGYGPLPPPSYPNMQSRPMSQRPRSLYNPRPSYRRYSSRRCRPIVRIIEADSCSSISTCSSISSCCCSTEYLTPQQPVILLPVQCQQQPLALPPVSNISSAPVVIQPLNSVPQMVYNAKPQQLQAGPIQYVQAIPRSASTSKLQSMPIQTYTSVAPQHVLVNSTNKQQSTITHNII